MATWLTLPATPTPFAPYNSKKSATVTRFSLTDRSLTTKDNLLRLISDQNRGLRTQSHSQKLSQIVSAIDDLASAGRDTVTTGISLSATWWFVWTTEKEQLFIIKNAPVFGTRAGDVLQVIVVENIGVSAFPEGESIFTWIGTIEGGKGTMYEGQSYKLSLNFPLDYPFKLPQVKFKTMCFHPNVDQYGNICLDILQDKWSSAYV